ncbi:MAG: tRNA threonylcarbamoyladenosine dehydratase [Clostridia bacterium]|nr:tRNA threonylcarbamoyladenosine dehydratase [Clostridia bacterium]
MEERFSRTEMMLGKNALDTLKNATVAVFGVGGVGGACVEALARGGVGHLVLIDSDTVSVSNINRQIIALTSTVGMAKVEAAKKRIKDICPHTKVTTHECFFLPENADDFDFSLFDYVVDAVDTVSAKLEIAVRASEAGVKVISAMGAGNKLDPSGFKVADVYDTKVCPLARAMRTNLKKRGVKKLKCVYSEELPFAPKHMQAKADEKPVPGSVSFVPPVMGYIMAGEVILDLTKTNR